MFILGFSSCIFYPCYCILHDQKVTGLGYCLHTNKGISSSLFPSLFVKFIFCLSHRGTTLAAITTMVLKLDLSLVRAGLPSNTLLVYRSFCRMLGWWKNATWIENCVMCYIPECGSPLTEFFNISQKGSQAANVFRVIIKSTPSISPHTLAFSFHSQAAIGIYLKSFSISKVQVISCYQKDNVNSALRVTM